MMNHANLFFAQDAMRNCIIRKKVDCSTTLELYDEFTNEFLLACVYCSAMSPMIIFVKMQNAHTRHFDELCCNLNLRQFVGKMIPDWMSGCNFKLTKFQDTEVCEIRIKHQILISAPVAFSVTILDEDHDESDAASIPTETEAKHLEPVPMRTSSGPSSSSSSSLFGFLGCGSELLSCATSSEMSRGTNTTKENAKKTESTGDTASIKSTSRYMEISKNICDSSLHRVESKPPKWNTELKQYTQNYGGRVKIASQKNFVGVHTSQIGNLDEFYSSASHDHSSDVCIRHGKVTHNTFVLDFKFPISPVVALAITVAAHVCQP